MKKFSLMAAMGFAVASLFAGSVKTEEFKVGGNCGMCEARIEKAALSVEGVTSAEWNKETKVIKVGFDQSATEIQKVHKAIASSGHDTELVSAKDATYEVLPGCCHYDRLKKQAMNCCSGSSAGCSAHSKAAPHTH